MLARTRRLAVRLVAVIALLQAAPTALAADNQRPIGTHDGSPDAIARLEGCYVNGWAIDPDHPDQDVTARIIVDGAELTTVVASDFRQDLLDAGIADGTAAFFLDLNGLVSPGVAHEILVETRDLDTGGWTALDFTPRSMTCTGLAGFHDTSDGTYPREDCRVEGWAFDGDAPTGPRVRVRVSVDGRVVAEATADILREDVRDAGYGDGFSGYSIDLFGRLTPDRLHVVTVEARDTNAKRIWLPLSETGRTMECQAS